MRTDLRSVQNMSVVLQRASRRLSLESWPSSLVSQAKPAFLREKTDFVNLLLLELSSLVGKWRERWPVVGDDGAEEFLR